MKRTLKMMAAAAVVTLFTVDAMAGGLLVARFGGEHGHPTTNNPTAMYYNPAGLSLGAGTRLYIDATLALRNFTYDRDPEAIDRVFDGSEPVGSTTAGTPPEGIKANSGKGSLTNFLASPFLGITSDFGIKGLGVGFGFYVPIGGQSVYDRSPSVEGFPGAEDGPQRWWAIEGTIRSLYFTGAVGYQVMPKLSVGLGVNLVRSEVYTARARNASGHDHLVSRTVRPDGSFGRDQLLEGRATVNLASNDLSLGVGLLYEPTPGMFIGLSYQSQPGFGENELEGDARLIIGTGDESKEKAIIQQQMPDVVRLGWRMELEHAQIRVFGNYARWSVFTDQCISNVKNKGSCDLANIPRDWEDTFTVRAGYSHYFGGQHQYEVLGGAGFDSSAVPDDTLEPALYDTDKVTLSLGGRVSLLDNSLALAGTFTQVIYFARDIAPRARDTNGESIVSGARNPDAAGKYTQSVGVFNLNVEYAF